MSTRTLKPNTPTLLTIIWLLAAILSPTILLAATLPAPINLSTVVQPDPQVRLSWQQPNTKFSGFEIQRSLTSAGGYATIMTVGRTTLSVADTQVQPGKSYYYQVRCFKSGRVTNYSAASNVAFAEIPSTVDSSPPAITIVNPASGTVISSAQVMTVSATATDNIGVSRVEFYDGSQLKATVQAEPFNFEWFVDSSGNGEHTLQARAYDAAGNVAFSNSVQMTIAIQATAEECPAPVLETVVASGADMIITWSLPQTAYGTPTGGYDIYVDDIDDNLHHSALNAVVGGLDQGEEHCFEIEARWTQFEPDTFLRSNRICAQLPDTTKPTVAMTSPAAGTSVTTAQTLTLTAAAQDNVGVSKVEFYAAGTLKGTDTSAPYTYAWSVSSANNGSHTLVAKAYDAAGNVASSAAVAVSVNITSGTAPSGPVKVFPGAQGFGADTKAGRGGQVIKVTNLNDSGPGSFRAAAQASGPRIIVFEVGGEIKLLSQLWISNPYVTIAGQTAPAPGVILSGCGLRIPTHDVLIQHIFVRHTANDGTDAIDVRDNGSAIPYNIVIDHVSVSWGDDENLSFAPGGTNTMNNNVTYSNNLVAEGNGSRYGTLISDGTKNFTAVGNLWMSHVERQPRVKGNVTASIVNNLSYNVGTGGFSVAGALTGIDHLSYVGNLFLPGPNTPSGAYAIGATSDMVSGSKVYLADNVMAGNMTNSAMNSYLVSSPPVSISNTDVMASHLVEDSVLANAGARPGERDGIVNNGIGDPIDERLIGEVRMGQGSLKSSPPSMPTFPPTSRAFAVPANPNGDDNNNGYTNIEEILYQMALQVEGR